MQIIIVGAGVIGVSLVELLAKENHDITVVDRKKEALVALRDRFDIRTVHGHGSSPEVLAEAGCKQAQALIAVTNDDETNLVACQAASLLFQTEIKICRIHSEDYMAHEEQLFGARAFKIDASIRPENLITRHIQRLIDYPNAYGVLEFAEGRVQLVGLKTHEGGPMLGKQIQRIHDLTPKIESRIAVIFRGDEALLPDGDTVIEDGDEVFFITARENIREVMRALRRIDTGYQSIFIGGGGRIGERVAMALQKDHTVKLLEIRAKRCEELATKLPNSVVVLNSDAANVALLREEGVEKTDVFLAVTNDDETNIMASALAKRMGAKRVMTLIRNEGYEQLAYEMDIDVVISPALITISSILKYLHKRNIVVSAQLLHGGAAEALEIKVGGNSKNSQLVGRAIDQVKWPESTVPAALLRGAQTKMPHHDLVIEPGDRMVMIVTDNDRIDEVEELFELRDAGDG